jgi:hypothetical protein
MFKPGDLIIPTLKYLQAGTLETRSQARCGIYEVTEVGNGYVVVHTHCTDFEPWRDEGLTFGIDHVELLPNV